MSIFPSTCRQNPDKRCVLALLIVCCHFNPVSSQEIDSDLKNLDGYKITKLDVGLHDWPQFGGTSLRNNTPVGKNIPTDWNVDTGLNIKWSAKLGSQTYPTPIVANGKVFIGTNNGAGYVKRFPGKIDLGCLLCFDEITGEFLWQHSNAKLKTGRRHDMPFQGIISVPVVDGDRIWYVTNRNEVVCLDTEGFRDGENDGVVQDEKVIADDEADVVWTFDMMGKLGVSPHNASPCSCTIAGDLLFVVTGNGVDVSHFNIPNPSSPSFLAINCYTGETIWTDNSPGENLLHGQWSSPTYAVLGGHPQILFPGGDCWLYSFDPQGDGNGGSKLLWKFDCNPKDSRYILGSGGRGKRNEHITIPVIYDNKIYVATGQDPEHGEGDGHLWCINPAVRFDGGEVSPMLAFDSNGQPLPPRRLQAADRQKGDVLRPNPDSTVVWDVENWITPGMSEKQIFENTMHRTFSSPAIKYDLLIITDFSGMVHCFDAQTGMQHWSHDLFAATWGLSPLIVEDKIYVTDEDGDITIFKLSDQLEIINEFNLGNSVYSTPIVANDVLFIANKNTLFAISPDGK
ncbi:MAG: PQQ-binding-like beta-propeller repeat protein [Planctomycetota bacterium]|nr:PQQ-binding-like beta-propeller repeat protein [Planctomycetota bacterium]MDA1214841.1 PQQ-binding-like beta-propeller repeat protein [Planctomycetota bacterium]